LLAALWLLAAWSARALMRLEAIILLTSDKFLLFRLLLALVGVKLSLLSIALQLLAWFGFGFRHRSLLG
jgi:ABC-type dipeptide/oligopeptide/nickel transport system permease subunit